MMKIVKSVGAVFAGMLLIIVFSVITDMLLEATGVFTPANKPELFVSWMAIVALMYRAVYASIGGYATAHLAPTNKMKHVAVLAAIGTIMGILGAVANWGKVSAGTEWYPLALVPISLLAVLGGGKISSVRFETSSLSRKIR